MARRKRINLDVDLPPGARRTSSGRITITIRAERDGRTLRLSHSKWLPTEPPTYETPREAWAGLQRVQDHLKENKASAQTLAGFWAKWSDPEHPINEARTEQTVIAYRARTQAFVKVYGHLPLWAITRRHLDEYRDNGGLLSHVGAISRVMHDARKRGLIAVNPLAEAAQDASKLIAKQTKEKRDESPPPRREQIEAMLTRLTSDGFPLSLFGWFVCGVETGMRGGEIDGMEWEFLDGDTYWIKRQWNAKLGKRTPCKHGSERRIRFNARVMAQIEQMRGNGSRYIWADSARDHWTHNTRDYWWTWSNDGQPSARQIVGGATMYNATRHFWATVAVNEMGLTPYEASLLYGHSDGGRLITNTYANPDHERAMQRALDRAVTPPVDLNAERDRRRSA